MSRDTELRETLEELVALSEQTTGANVNFYRSKTRGTWVIHVAFNQKVEERLFSDALKQAIETIKKFRKLKGGEYKLETSRQS